MRVRDARIEDREAIAAFTRNTWPDREVGDYVADIFPDWVESDGETRRTLVIEDEGNESGGSGAGDVVAVARVTLLSPYEAWAQGMRVDPERRGEGLATRLTRAVFEWARDRGAVVCRNMVFSWNALSLGLSRRAGFAPATEFRWAHPTPDADADPGLDVGGDARADADGAWAFWAASDAATHLRGLALDAEVAWAVSELTRERLHEAAGDGRLLTVRDGGTRGFSLRTRTFEREGSGERGGEVENETWAEYAVGAWADLDAARALFRAIGRDAAAVGADETRVLVPEGVRWVSDVAAARVAPSDEPDFVLAADLTDESLLSG